MYEIDGYSIDRWESDWEPILINLESLEAVKIEVNKLLEETSYQQFRILFGDKVLGWLWNNAITKENLENEFLYLEKREKSIRYLQQTELSYNKRRSNEVKRALEQPKYVKKKGKRQTKRR